MNRSTSTIKFVCIVTILLSFSIVHSALDPAYAQVEHTINITGEAGSMFEPDFLVIPIDVLVTWSNQDTSPHDLSISGVFADRTLEPGERTSFVFEETGNFDYFVDGDSGHSGTIVVSP